MAGKGKITGTKNYALFHRSTENRPLDLRKHRKLFESMKLYGFLKCFPIVVVRDKDGKLVIKDGQHRLTIAAELGLTVWYVEEEIDFDVALVNCTAKVWVLRDYAQKYAANGLKDYAEVLEFSEQHSLSIGTAFALLAGQTNSTNCLHAFIDGSYRVKDRAWANAVAGIYGPLILMSEAVKNTRCIEACMAVCRVKDFDAKRLIAGAERCREKLVAYSTRDAYLDMLEVIYNYGRKQLVGLKALAQMAMRERNPAKRPKPEAE